MPDAPRPAGQSRGTPSTPAPPDPAAERRAKARERQARWRARKLAGVSVLPVEIDEKHVANLPERLVEMGLLDPAVEPDAEAIAMALGMLVEAQLEKK